MVLLCLQTANLQPPERFLTMPPAPPPDPVPQYARASHVLRPHHILLLYIFALGFQLLDENPLPGPFTLALHRIMIRDVVEVGVA